MGPQSRPTEFNSRFGRSVAWQTVRLSVAEVFVWGRTFRGESATTGSPAVISSVGR
jgi:hypothetical protein